ncbi:hypothetical protein [Streptomyces iconiensis]|uniref:Glutathionylspermidine synthase n=1 Tax=Streptomyces iconiensis TaxID=1384038 RepID=A0ABT7AAS9_9ACTN|nr:hypothetical protein [Streptomyces iconiensis]MDJ1138099.1 hypothetical protein [Streptomyces iconiensis]
MINDVPDGTPLIGAELGLGARPPSPGLSDPLIAAAAERVEARVAALPLLKTGSPTGPGASPWPVLPAVSVLHPEAEPVLRHRAVTVVRCLQEVVRRYPSDTALQELLDVPPALRRWALRQPGPERLTVDMCRLDLLGDTLGTVGVLEFNASSPGSVLLGGLLNRFWRESRARDLLDAAGAAWSPVEDETWFASWLITHGERHGVPEEDSRRVGLFAAPWQSRSEFGLMEEQLTALGRESVVLEPGDVEHAAGLRLGYFKYVPRDLDEPARWNTFCSRIAEGDLVVPNVPAERWVAENKLCLAALSDPRFRRLFTADECAALDALVPFSRKLGDGITESEALAEQPDLVLKAPYSAWGKDVVIGAGTSQDAWRDAVRAPEHRGWLVQRRITTNGLPTGRGTYFRDLTVSVLDGQVVGYGGRMSTDPVVNVAREGATTTVLSPHDPRS